MMYSKDKHDCPRGFEFSNEKGECVPIRGGVDDKLTQRYERYFFKEEENTMKDIDKLVDEAFDGGFTNFAKSRKVEKKVDMILDSMVEEEDDRNISTTGKPYDHPIKMKVVPSIDGSVEVRKEEMPMKGSGEEFEDSEYEEGPSKPDNPKKMANDINHVPNQKAGNLIKSVRDELSEGMIWQMIAEMRKDAGYKAYFKKMLSKYGYNSPADIPAEKKKDFFNAVDRNWKSKKEK